MDYTQIGMDIIQVILSIVTIILLVKLIREGKEK